MNKDKLIYAGFKVRFFAGAVDTIIIFFLIFFSLKLLMLSGVQIKLPTQNQEKIETILKKEDETTIEKIKEIEKTTEQIDPKTQKLINQIAMAISSVYSVYFVSSKKQGTPGKQLFKIMIIDRKVGRMSVLNAFIRFVAKIINNMLFGIGYIPILFTKEKVSLHDFLSNTRVVYIKTKDTK